ncbi:hypothetical protein AGMMS4956_15030 [Bacteroidia bacterium]|nr:hypothetical protein AGMMS4956_15030 [Bacteroidia bacterium]
MPLQLKIDKDKLADKIKGGWAGKTIGCTYGGPVEFVYNGTFIHDYAPIDWEDGKIKWYYDNFPGLYDDLYVNITFVDVFERLGLTAPADSFAMAFANAGYPLWHANQVARSNIAQGILPPASGYWQNNPHADDIDYQIEADFAGLMSPAMPNTASEISDKIGHIITYGDGWYGGVFTGAMYSLAFVYDDAATVVCEALKTIPSQSDFYQCIADVICWHKANPEDWKQAWFECEKKWASEIGCPDGVFLPFNIDAKINSAYVVIGLLYGKGNFYRTMDIAARCGQDADCNAATAAGVLGTLLGYSQIPETWKKNLYEVENLNFAYTTISLNKLYELSLKQALQVVEQQGGSIDGNTVAIKSQKPQSVKYEKSFEEHYPVKKQSVHRNITQNPNLSFGGIGIVVKGYVQSPNPNYIANVEVVLDGKRDSLYLPVATSLSIDKRKVDLYWKYQLPENKHEIRFKWLNPQKDAMVYFTEAIVYSR